MIGKVIKTLREEKGISQRKLAGQVGLANTTLSYIENGVVIPKAQTLIALAKALGVPPIKLIEEAYGEEVLT